MIVRIEGLFELFEEGPCVCRSPEVGVSRLSSQRQNLSSLERGISSAFLAKWPVSMDCRRIPLAGK